MINRYLFTLILSFTCLLLCQRISFAQPQPGFSQGELLIINQTKWYATPGQKILLKIFPVGATYHGDENGNNQYSPDAITGVDFNLPRVITDTFIVGYQKILQTQQIDLQNTHYVRGAWDGATSNNECNFAFGMALYKIEFWSVDEFNGPVTLLNYLFVDYRNANINIPGQYQYNMDLCIEFFTNSLVTFNFFNDSHRHNIDTVGKLITHWHQFGNEYQNLNRQPNRGNFVLDSSNQEYLVLPIDANKYNGNIGHENPGDLGMNLVINHNVTTRDTLIVNPTNIILPVHGYLKINSGKTFNMIPVTGGYNNLIIQDSSLLLLTSNSQVIVGYGNRLTLKNKGVLTMWSNAHVIFQNGSLFCNEGGKINGTGSIIFEKGAHLINCMQLADLSFTDSSKLVLSDSASLEIPDSTTIHFSGPHSGLIMNPHSKFKMGVGSKIVFDGGASITAKNASFVSSDSSNIWDGIVFSNSGDDTIVGCTFNNAKTSLSISYTNLINNPNKIIRKNTFNVNHAYGRGIDARSISQLFIDSNTFNLNSSNNTVGIFLETQPILRTHPEAPIIFILIS